jgi:glutamine cyclotransferase
MSGRLTVVVLLCVAGLIPAACGRAQEAETSEAAVPPDSPPPDSPQRLEIRVLATRPHDPQAYTQGLLVHGGTLYESTGLYGSSSLRQVEPATGEVVRRIDLPADQFGEGLALAGETLVQLTWREEVAPIWDLATLTRKGEHRYQGEGWGLCFDGRRFYMSDGSDRLTVRDATTFAVVGEIKVTREGIPVDRLNELECAEGAVWANVYETDAIVRIDPATGKVTGVADGSNLLAPAERLAAEVMNGIAYDAEQKRFYITGKRWPKVFEVVFEPAVGR